MLLSKKEFESLETKLRKHFLMYQNLAYYIEPCRGNFVKNKFSSQVTGKFKSS